MRDGVVRAARNGSSERTFALGNVRAARILASSRCRIWRHSRAVALFA